MVSGEKIIKSKKDAPNPVKAPSFSPACFKKAKDQEISAEQIPSGKCLQNDGKVSCFMGKLTVNGQGFNSYFRLPEGILWLGLC